jgi:hypothetical protein
MTFYYHKFVHSFLRLMVMLATKYNEQWFFIFLFFIIRFVKWRYKLNIWDIGGQKSLRSYWRNYFEQTDGKFLPWFLLSSQWIPRLKWYYWYSTKGLIWVVDCTDRQRLEDCRIELHKLLQEEVPCYSSFRNKRDHTDVEVNDNNVDIFVFVCSKRNFQELHFLCSLTNKT